MRYVLSAIIIAILYSCSSTRGQVKIYYYVEPFKEQEIKLFLRNDSTFIFNDLTGCNQFEFTGKYNANISSTVKYVVFSSVKLRNVLSKSTTNSIFFINDGDTAWIINNERVFIHKQPFIATVNSRINLQEIRYKKLKSYYIDFLGKKSFLKVFGNGNKREAKKRLLDCKLPDIIVK